MSQDGRARDFLGRGWAFPVRVDAATGRIETSAFEDDIAEAIRVILQTRRGERVMQPSFGCAIHDYVYQGSDSTTRMQMENEILRSLTAWEPRIRDATVEVLDHESQANALSIRISYRVRATNNLYNRVYPFYLNEGIR